jgi:FlaG/FlaF family flagellin (archaellin)
MRTHLLKLFTEDDRAVAPIIGFILLFGILTIAFAGYQAEQVPQQNAETEFQHYQDVQNDLIVVRNAISRAGQQNQSQFESVRLGTNYRKRILALNPPDPTGTLRTSDSYPITIEEGEIEGGRTPVAASPIPTRFLTYQNGYNELEVAPIQYDNSVLYLSDPDGDEAVVFEEQNLVRNNGDVVLTALQNPFDRSATGRVTIELYPTASAPATLPDGTLTITIPTKLSADYWTDALAETTIDEANYNMLDATEAYSEAPDVRGLELQVTADDLVFNTVGIGSAPEGSDSPTTGIGNPLPTPTPTSCTIGSTNNPGALQFDKLQNFQTKSNQGRWQVNVQVQDADGDNDLSQLKLEVTDSNGIVRGSETRSISGQQYNPGNVRINANSGYSVQRSETYSLTATVCDSDGNSRTQTP